MKEKPPKPINESYLHIQLKIAAILAESTNLNTDAQKILNMIGEFFGWQVGEIWAVDPSKKVVICVSQWLASNRFKKIKALDYLTSHQKGEGVAGIIWKNKSPYWSQHVGISHPSWPTSMVDKFGLNGCFGVPIHFNEEILGILLFYSQSIPTPDHELLELFSSIGQQIATFIKRRRIEDELLFLSQHDRLTGLANRTILEKRINTEINYALNHQTKAVLLYLDLDNFKHINDTLGHAMGDILLEKFSLRLGKLVRDADTVARLGGDEFAILLSNVKSNNFILSMVDKIFKSMQKPFSLAGKKQVVTLSIGVSVYPNDCNTGAELIINADKAMYRAKKSGKNNSQFFSEMGMLIHRDSNELMNDLPKAMEADEFRVDYQPILSINTNTIVGHEAKLRWQHPQGRVLNVLEFLPVLLEKNIFSEVQTWFIMAICSQLYKWREQQFDPGIVHIPMLQLTEKFISTLKQYFGEDKLSFKILAVEINEAMLLETTRHLTTIIDLKKLGISIVIENYGAQTSSINLLKNFRVDSLKIDHSFIVGLPDDLNACAVVKATIAMAKSLKIKTIAEGVENQSQLGFLKAQGCDEYQPTVKESKAVLK